MSMHRRWLPAAVAATAVAAMTIGSAHVRGQSRSPEWEEYEFHQYVALDGTSPSSILQMDDNGRLVLMAESGLPEAELLARTGAAESQIELLKAWRLLARDGELIRTSFPILDARETTWLRSLTEEAANALLPTITGDAARLRDELAALGRAENTYSILFSYALDDLVWDVWERGGILSEREVTRDRPFWAGEVWAVTPERREIVGTNSILDERGRLSITWSHKAIPRMRPFVADIPSLKALFEAFASGERIRDPSVRAVFEPYDLLDPSGRPTYPVIVAESSDPVHRIATRIASVLSDRTCEVLDLSELVEKFGFRDRSQALVVAYHELMWDLLGKLVDRGIVSRPPVLDGKGRDPSDVAALVYGVRTRPSVPATNGSSGG